MQAVGSQPQLWGGVLAHHVFETCWQKINWRLVCKTRWRMAVAAVAAQQQRQAPAHSAAVLEG